MHRNYLLVQKLCFQFCKLMGKVTRTLCAFLRFLSHSPASQKALDPMLYLLHFNPRYRHSGHDLGYSQDVIQRFGLNLKGKGSPFVAPAVKRGSKVVLVRIWSSDGIESRS